MPPEVDIRMSDISVPITDIEQNMIVDANLFLAQQPVFDEALMPVEEEPAQFIIPNSLPAFPAVPVA